VLVAAGFPPIGESRAVGIMKTHPCPVRSWHMTKAEADKRADETGGVVGRFGVERGNCNWFVDCYVGVTSAAPVEFDPPFLAKETT
jgi:hypothetical protein